MAQLCIGWLFSCLEFPSNDDPRHSVESELVKLCKRTIAKLGQPLSEHYVMNKHQCVVLVKKLSQTQDTLAFILRSSDERTTLVLQELHKVLLSVDRLIQSNCNIPSSQLWLRVAIEHGDMKETFSKLLYDVQWHTILLQTILMDCSAPPRETAFNSGLCVNGLLNPIDEFALRMAMKEDEKLLKDCLSSVKLDFPVQRDLADQLLKQMKTNLEQSTVVIVGKDSGNDAFVTSPFKLLFINPQDLKKCLLLCGEVHKLCLLGAKYAIKSFDMHHHNESFEDEIAALQRLGHHPNVVSLFYYSRNSEECFLIMEEMDMELSEFLKLRNDKLSNVEAVALMLQIADGVRFVHSEDLALKSRKVLVTLTDCGSICSAKIADFGLCGQRRHQIKDAMWTDSNQVVNGEGVVQTAEFNPRKADVYSFALICSEILTKDDPACGELESLETKKKVKLASGSLNPKPSLPEDCPRRLASLIRCCSAGNFGARPEFSEICQELRYLKGLLLRGDKDKLETEFISDNRMEHEALRGCGTCDKEGDQFSRMASTRSIRQGPWGREEPHKKTGLFDHVANSIKWIRLKYQQTPPGVGFLEVGYVEPDGEELVEAYCQNIIGTTWRTIKFELDEYITQVSGSVAQHEVTVSDSRCKVGLVCIVSLTIHTNRRSYGPFGDETTGKQFRSGTGIVTGFFGAGGVLLDKLGVWMIPDGQDDGDQSFLIEQ